MANEITLEILDVNTIEYNEEFNCRGKIVIASCKGLADSIKAEGLGQPITVAPKEDGTYKLITGHRRFIAVTKVLRRKKIMCVINPELIDPRKAKIVNLTENVQRDQLSLLQELTAVQGLLNLDLDKDEVAKRCGKSRNWVSQRLKIRDLPAVIQQEIDAGLLKMSQVNELHDYTYMHDKTKIFEIAKGMKKANANRRNFNKKKHVCNQDHKAARSKKEIAAMRDHMLSFFESNLATRMLSWACGDLGDNDMHTFLEEYSIENDFELIIGVERYDRPF